MRQFVRWISLWFDILITFHIWQQGACRIFFWGLSCSLYSGICSHCYSERDSFWESGFVALNTEMQKIGLWKAMNCETKCEAVCPCFDGNNVVQWTCYPVMIFTGNKIMADTRQCASHGKSVFCGFSRKRVLLHVQLISLLFAQESPGILITESATNIATRSWTYDNILPAKEIIVTELSTTIYQINFLPVFQQCLIVMFE